MKGILSKTCIFICLTSIFGCSKQENELDCRIYGERFQIYFPYLENERFTFNETASDQSMNVFSSENHRIVIFVTARFDSSYFEMYFDENYYQHRILNGDTTDNSFSIPISYSVTKKKIIQEWIVFNTLASNHDTTNRFSVRYMYNEINELSSIAIEFRKEFPSFNIIEVYDWINKLREIRIVKKVDI